MLSTQKTKKRCQCAIGASLLMLSLLWLSMPSLAQNFDDVTPIMEVEHLKNGVADHSQVFTVQISENQSVEEASLFFRREGELPYQEIPMKPLGDTGYYSVSVSTDPSDTRTIEYYVQARDFSGNRTISGFAFDPYQRTLKPALSPLQQPAPDPVRISIDPPTPIDNSPPPLLRQRWVQVTLGVLAVGILAAAASAGGGDDTQLVNVTFTAQ